MALFIQDLSNYLPGMQEGTCAADKGIFEDIFKGILEEMAKGKDDTPGRDDCAVGCLSFRNLIMDADFSSLIAGIERLLSGIEKINAADKLSLLKGVTSKLVSFILQNRKSDLFTFLNELLDCHSKEDVARLLGGFAPYGRDSDNMAISVGFSGKGFTTQPAAPRGESAKIVVKLPLHNADISLPSPSASAGDEADSQLIKDVIAVLKSAGIGIGNQQTNSPSMESMISSSMADKNIPEFLKSLADNFNIVDETAPAVLPSGNEHLNTLTHYDIPGNIHINERIELLSLIKDAVEKAQIQNHNNVWQTHIELNPPVLGRAHLLLTLEGERVVLNLFVASADLKETVSSIMPDLQHALESKGLVLESFNVDVNSHLPFGNRSYSGQRPEQHEGVGSPRYRLPSVSELASVSSQRGSDSLYVERNRINCFA